MISRLCITFALLLLGCSNPYERDNPRDYVHVYTVTFGAGEAAGGVPPADIEGHYGDVIQLPNQGGLARYGFGLRKWKADSLGKMVSYEAGGRYTVTGNIAMSAVWVPIYSVVFDGNGATGGLPPAAVSADSGTVTVLPANGTLERAGYSFAGWDAVSPYTVTGNATLYAKWIPIYAVAFDGNGATSGLPPAAVSADSGTVIELPANGTLGRAGYSFAGWNTDSSGTGAGYAAGSSYAFAGNATLYAVWSLTPTLACTMTATTGTVGTAISPAPTVTCNGTAVTSGLAWTPANLTPTSTGSLAVSVSASSGVCSGMTASCGSVSVPVPLSSSSSRVPSSSSVVPSSSSVVPSSSSALPSSSSFAIVSNCSANFRTVTIGTQVWAAENLNCDVEGSVCHSNEQSNCATYGRLYNWATAMGLPSSCNSNTCSGQIQSPHRGICPSGWHIPSNADWDKLYRYADGTSGTESPYSSPTAGTKLKSTSGWNSYSGVPVGTDQYGFSALPGGYGGSGGSFDDAGNDGGWWSASEGSSYNAYFRYMLYDNEGAGWGLYDKSYLFSVRCLQD